MRNPPGRRDAQRSQDGAVRLNKTARRDGATTRATTKKVVPPGSTAREVKLPTVAEGLIREEGAVTFGSLNAKAVADALRNWTVTRSPSRQIAVVRIGESDEQVLVNLDKLDLNKDEALVLYGVVQDVFSEARPESRARQGSTTHRSPHDDRQKLKAISPSVSSVGSADIGIARVSSHPVRSTWRHHHSQARFTCH